MEIYNLRGKLLPGVKPLSKSLVLGKEYVTFENGIAMKCNANLVIPKAHYREITSHFVSTIMMHRRSF